MSTIILASGSAIRAHILENAGVAFEVIRPDADEDAIKDQARNEGLDHEQTATRLAEEKALSVDSKGWIIGSDQILEFQGKAYDKPKDMAEARQRLKEMQGASHTLINAVVVANAGEIIWRHIDRPVLTIRAMNDPEIDDYLATAGEDILSSVGAYQVEKLGSRLFENIDGDHFAVLGLSLFPLLGFLRGKGALAF